LVASFRFVPMTNATGVGAKVHRLLAIVVIGGMLQWRSQTSDPWKTGRHWERTASVALLQQG
jgi:hypothetical protein